MIYLWRMHCHTLTLVREDWDLVKASLTDFCFIFLRSWVVFAPKKAEIHRGLLWHDYA